MTVQNILRTVRQGTTKPVRAAVKGNLPKWLNGSLFRNGAGRFEFNDKYHNHLFDGAACVNKFEIIDGDVVYSNKFLETVFYKESLKKGIVGQFGSVSEKSNIFDRLKSLVKIPAVFDNTSVCILPYMNKLYASTESNKINQLDPKDMSILKTIDIEDHFSGVLKNSLAHSHALRDGSWINMGWKIERGKGYYAFFKCQGGEKEAEAENLYKNGKVLATIPSSHADGISYYHSFSLTENYIVHLESPIKINFKKHFINTVLNKPIIDSYETDYNFPTRIHVVNLNTGEVLPQKFTTDAQFSFHHINAYEQKESDECTNLIVDVASYNCGRNGFSLQDLTYKNLNEGLLQNTERARGLARRITVPLSKNNKPGDEVYCQIDTLNPEVLEFPTINYGRNNQLPYKYFYCHNAWYSKPFTVMKINVEDPKDTLKFAYNIEEGKNIVPMEPIFVENPNPKGEDDGVVLVQVLSDDNDFLSVLDAKTLTEIARADLPKDVKSTFTAHGFFADKTQMLSMLKQ